MAIFIYAQGQVLVSGGAGPLVTGELSATARAPTKPQLQPQGKQWPGSPRSKQIPFQANEAKVRAPTVMCLLQRQTCLPPRPTLNPGCKLVWTQLSPNPTTHLTKHMPLLSKRTRRVAAEWPISQWHLSLIPSFLHSFISLFSRPSQAQC